MSNDFHLLLIPKEPNSLSRLMQWIMTSHVRYYHKKNKTLRHIWQGRYKSFICRKRELLYNAHNIHRSKSQKS